jgi:hypothetical protein
VGGGEQETVRSESHSFAEHIMFDKLLQLLHASNKYGLALVFMGIVFYLDQSLGFLPFRLSEAQAGWVIVATLLGAGMSVADFIARLCSLAGRGWRTLCRWWKARTVMNRLDELTAREQLALYWIAHHKGENVSGSRYADPFQRLCKKGYLIATDETGAVQSFKINRRVYAKKSKLLPYIPESYRHISGDYDHPW